MIYVILGLMLLGLLILAVPVSLGYDTGEPWLKIKWLGLTLRKSLTEKKKLKQKAKTTTSPKRSRPVMLRLWEKRDLCLELLQRFWHLFLAVLRTLNFRGSEAGISLPDPMWNGLLSGVVSNIHVDNFSLLVNFDNRNYAKIRVTVYPYRVMRQVTIFLLRLPYLRMMRFAWGLKKNAQSSKHLNY